jgi:hypothetical protein
MIVLCAGMQRSASTWQYEVVCHLVERHRDGRRLGFFQNGEEFDKHLRTNSDSSTWRVMKSHQGHPSYSGLLREGTAVAVYSYRDLRDVAFSLAHKCGSSFEEVVERRGGLHDCLEDDRFWTTQPRTLVQRYEQVTADPVNGIKAIAGHLGISLESREAEAVAEQYSLQANAGRAAALKRQLTAAGVDLNDISNAHRKDEKSLLHWNHIREGKVGGWREQATPRQIALLAAACGGWLRERGFESDDSWALSGLEEMRKGFEQSHRRLAELQRKLRDAEQEIASFRQLGPVAIGVAQRLHAWSVRHPRLRGMLKQLSACSRAFVASGARGFRKSVGVVQCNNESESGFYSIMTK